MNKLIPACTDRPAFDESERVWRQTEVDFARGSVRYEGGILSKEIERLNARYIAGEIDSDELTAAILASDTARP
ncbi:antitoxin VbhA family protein [Sphingomonas sp. BAUL-RG-20F-R05-02]|uniref:antitoxin VbhA family protein n=1 Tax=Sphingomonas sp. BAUL-RG-20F-R05-02 TaxID=2914830 RepID=UPI001F56B504|nr:antitoxin VbhA family protein [Sphingomonas sp. BAUL-RG-20F-R05-02]